MPLTKQLVHVPFIGGIDTKTDDKQVQPSKVLELFNGNFSAPGKIQKTHGTKSLGIPSGQQASGAKALATLNNQLLSLDGENIWSFSSGLNVWESAGRITSPTVYLEDTSQANPQFSGLSIIGFAADSGVAPNGLRLLAHESSSPSVIQGPVVYSISDTETGTAIFNDSLIANASPKVLVVGTDWWVFAVNVTAGTINLSVVGSTDPLNFTTSNSAVTSTAVGDFSVASLSSGVVFDACLIGDTVYLVFLNRSGSITVRTFKTPNDTAVYYVLPAPATPTNVGIFADYSRGVNAGSPVFLFSTVDSVWFYAYEADMLTSLAGPISIMTGTVSTPGSIAGVSSPTDRFISWTIFINFPAQSPYNDSIFISRVGVAYFVNHASLYKIGCLLCGKPVPYVARSGAATVFVPVSFTDADLLSNGNPQQASYFLLDDAGIVLARWLYQDAVVPMHSFRAVGRQSGFILPESQWVSPGNLSIVCFKSVGGHSDYVIRYVSARVVFDDSVNGYLRANLGGALLTSGGQLWMYDGRNSVEYGFLLFPEILEAFPTENIGLVGPGTWQYVVCYSWVDASGRKHRSAPSAPESVVIPDGGVGGLGYTITIIASGLSFTNKTGVFVEIYRTEKNLSVFHFLGLEQGGAFGSRITFTDKMSDDVIRTNEQLYTSGGVAENVAPGPVGPMCVHRNRIFAADTTNPLVLNYSKEIQSDVAPVEFGLLFQMLVDARGGPITAVASLDDKLIIFKRTLIFAVTGQGPDATGGQNDFSDAQIVSADTGCDTPRSIVLMPQGLMFHGPKGIYLLGRNLTVEYIGADAEANNSTPPAAAVMVPGTRVIRFPLSSKSTTLEYDYLMNQWGHRSGNRINVDAVTFGEGYALLGLDGEVQLDAPGQFLLGGRTQYEMRVKTAWIKVAGLQGAQRIYKILVLGSYKSQHTLVVNLYYDYNSSIAETHRIVVSSDPNPYQFRISPARQRCEAIQVEISDLGSGESMDLSGLAFEVGIIGGARRMRSEQAG